MFFPINSLGSLYPSRRAAEGLEKRQVPSESQPKIASVAEASIKWTRSSTLSRASFVCPGRVLFPAKFGDIIAILQLHCSAPQSVGIFRGARRAFAVTVSCSI